MIQRPDHRVSVGVDQLGVDPCQDAIPSDDLTTGAARLGVRLAKDFGRRQRAALLDPMLRDQDAMPEVERLTVEVRRRADFTVEATTALQSLHDDARLGYPIKTLVRPVNEAAPIHEGVINRGAPGKDFGVVSLFCADRRR